MNNEEKILGLLERMDERQNKTDLLLERLDERQNRTEQILGELQQGQTATNSRLDKMGERFDKMEARQDELEREVREGFKKVHGDIGDPFRNSDKNIKLIVEGLGHLNERYAQLDKVEKQTDDHDNRIFAIEQKIGNG